MLSIWPHGCVNRDLDGDWRLHVATHPYDSLSPSFETYYTGTYDVGASIVIWDTTRTHFLPTDAAPDTIPFIATLFAPLAHLAARGHLLQ